MCCPSKMSYQSMIIIVFLTIASMAQATNKTLPVKYPVKIIPESNTICPSTEERETTFAEIDQEINALIRNTVLPTFQCPGIYPQNPAASCLEIAECDPSLPSGYYWINTNNQIYCDMDREVSCSSGTGGWTRVVYLNMTDSTQQCPSAWREITSPIRTCAKRTNAGCDSVTFSANGIQYSNVLGQVVAYQFGTVDGFTGRSIDSHYLDGVSITHGMHPRNHIWSFAAEWKDNIACPCSTSYTTPSFVGEDYFCESGNAGSTLNNVFYPDDPLWDGQGCGTNPTCCTYNNPPWFCKQLPQATTDDIEIRLCTSEDYTGENTPIELIEIYIQ